MKTFLASCFACLFLLAVVAGCPGSSAEPQKGGNTVNFEEQGTSSGATSTSDISDDISL